MINDRSKNAKSGEVHERGYGIPGCCRSLFSPLKVSPYLSDDAKAELHGVGGVTLQRS